VVSARPELHKRVLSRVSSRRQGNKPKTTTQFLSLARPKVMLNSGEAMQKVEVQLEDDLTGGPADETPAGESAAAVRRRAVVSQESQPTGFFEKAAGHVRSASSGLRAR
jgi:hypothetical protein